MKAWIKDKKWTCFWNRWMRKPPLFEARNWLRKRKCFSKVAVCLFLFCVCILFLPVHRAFAEDSIDFGSLDRSIKKEAETTLSSEEMLEKIKKGELLSLGKELFLGKLEKIIKEGKIWKELFVQLLVIGLFLALFSNLSKSFMETYMGTFGYYIAFLVLSGILIKQFSQIYQMAIEGLNQLVNFMKILIPAYAISMVAASGISTSMATYEWFFALIALVEWGILKIILPGIKIACILKMLNLVAGEDLFSGMIQFLEDGLKWILKMAIRLVLLFDVIQSMILPVADALKQNLMQGGVGLIPGVGRMFGMLVNTAIGSGILLKNSIGVLGMFVVCLIIFIPILKMACYSLSFQLAGALLQPITDKQIYLLFRQISDSGKLLIHAVFTAGVLFLLTISILSLVTT